MDAIWGLLFSLAAFILLASLAMSFDWSRNLMGFGDVPPTGLPGWIAGFVGGGDTVVPEAEA